MSTLLAIGFLLTACSSSYFSIRFIKERFKNELLEHEIETLLSKLSDKSINSFKIEVLTAILEKAVENEYFELANSIYTEIKSIQNDEQKNNIRNEI